MMQPAKDFASLSLPGYRNINELVALDDQLHVCESLFGDHDAETLIFAQDAANFEKMRDWFVRYGRQGIRHDEKAPTNKHLLGVFARVRDDENHAAANKTCGLFYANAIWLFKEGQNMSSELPSPKEAARVCLPVTKATIEGLPKLRLVLALGEQAYKTLRLLDPSLSPRWSSAVRDSAVQSAELQGRKVAVLASYHFGNRGSRARERLELMQKGVKTRALDLFKADIANARKSCFMRLP